MSHSIDASDRDNLNGHENFDYNSVNAEAAGFNTANKTNDESCDIEKKLSKNSMLQSGINLDQ